MASGRYEAEAVSKQFGSTRALTDVDFSVAPGEVHALVGANGAGKSTLVKILVGVQPPDSGTLTLAGRQVELSSMRDAFDKGIAVVAQDLNLFGELTVLANLFLQREPRRGGLVNLAAMRERAAVTLETVGLEVDPRAKVSSLSQSDKQRVALARAVLFRPQVLLLDEPTSALQPREKEKLLEVVRRLRARGTAIVYVSHFLEEIFAVADRITVLRDGRCAVGGIAAVDTSLPATVRAMTGDPRVHISAVPDDPSRPATRREQAVNPKLSPKLAVGVGLRVERLSRANEFEDVSFTARHGEIFGLAGLEGSGTRPLLASMFGAGPAHSGSVVLPDGREVGRSIPASVQAGVAYVPADRQQSGLMPQASILDNLMQVRIGTLGRGPLLLAKGPLRRRAQALVEELGIKVGDLEDRLTSLSGGNQQKVLMGKWLEADARVYLLDDPTAAVDVHSRAEMHQIIRDIAEAGSIVVVASNDPIELLQLCHRVAVMHEGRLRDVLETVGLGVPELLEAVNTGSSPPTPSTGTVTPNEEGLRHA